MIQQGFFLILFIFNHQTNATIIKSDLKRKKKEMLRQETETHLANLAKGNMAEFLIDKHRAKLQIGFRYT